MAALNGRTDNAAGLAAFRGRFFYFVTTGLDPVVHTDARRTKTCGEHQLASPPYGLPGQGAPRDARRGDPTPGNDTRKIVLAARICARVLRTVARIERSEIRGRTRSFNAIPDFTAFNPGYEEREAERRKAHPTNVRARADEKRERRRSSAGAARAADKPARTLPNLSASGRARLPALHCGTRHASRNQHWLSSRTGFPAAGRGQVFCPPQAVCRGLTRSAWTGPFAGRPGPQSRPGARGHRSRSISRPSPVTSPNERDSRFGSEMVTDVKEKVTTMGRSHRRHHGCLRHRQHSPENSN
jgi:hypothetical protein